MPTYNEFATMLGECHWITVRHIAQMLGIPTPLFSPEFKLDGAILDKFETQPSKVYTAYLLNIAIRQRRLATFEKVFPYLIKAVDAGLTVTTPAGAGWTVLKAILKTLNT
jgi:hypothetical protein